MANTTFRGLAGKVLLRCPSATLTLAQDWVRQAWTDLVEHRRWSFMLRRGTLATYNQYNTGTATILAGTNTVTLGGSGVVDNAHVGRQFRIGNTFPIATITAVSTSANTYTLDTSWWPSDSTAQSFSVYQAYLTVPSDFHSFVSIVDPAFFQPIPFDGSVQLFDNMDPQRAAAGSPPRSLAYFDFYGGSGTLVPRYEMWPHQRSASVYLMTYECRLAEPWDASAVIPYTVPDTILLERSMMHCAMWPGSDDTKPNPYFNPKLGLAQLHKAEYEKQLTILEKQDNEMMQQNIWYQSEQARRSPIVSGSWMQSHDLAP